MELGHDRCYYFESRCFAILLLVRRSLLVDLILVFSSKDEPAFMPAGGECAVLDL